MDRLIYTAASGARALMQRQDGLAQNLANANTTGYRADEVAFRAVPVRGEGATTRVMSLEATAGFDAKSGPVQGTGRELDVAVKGAGWLSVQTPDGGEAYTRNGGLQVSADGIAPQNIQFAGKIDTNTGIFLGTGTNGQSLGGELANARTERGGDEQHAARNLCKRRHARPRADRGARHHSAGGRGGFFFLIGDDCVEHDCQGLRCPGRGEPNARRYGGFL